MTQAHKSIIISLLILISLISGYFVSRGGKPYGIPLFSLHKLAAVAAAVFLILYLRKAPGGAIPFRDPAAAGAAAALAGLVLLAVSGGVISVLEAVPAPVKFGHSILPYLTLIASAVTAWATIFG